MTNLLTLSLASLRAQFRSRAPEKRIVALHDTPNSAQLRSKMMWLKERYKIVSISELLSSTSYETSLVAITLDDGYSNWVTVAAPVCSELEVPATFFVCSGLLDLPEEKEQDYVQNNLGRTQHLKLLSTEELQSLAKSPLFTIGSHTVSHCDLGQLPVADLEREVLCDKQMLEGKIGQKVEYFAYPYGKAKHVTPMAKEFICNHFAAGLSIVQGAVISGDDTAFLPRISLDPELSNQEWSTRLRGGFDGF